ncbi:MAG: TolB family protein, partial [Bdellovibrionota bacterium]
MLLAPLLLSASAAISPAHAAEPLAYPAETHLRNLRQLTFEGINSDAHFSPDGRWLVYQSKDTMGAEGCEQIFKIRSSDGSDLQRLSGGQGRATSPSF